MPKLMIVKSMKFFTDGQAYSSSGNLISFGSNLIIAISSFFIKNLKANYLSLNVIFGSFFTFGLIIHGKFNYKKNVKKNFIFYILLMILFLPSLNFLHLVLEKLVFVFICMFISLSLDDYNHNKYFIN